MNRIGLHMGYWWGTEYDNDLSAMIRLTARTGAGYIEMNPRYFLHMSAEERRGVRQYAADNGIGITVNGGPGNANDITSDDPAAREEGLRFYQSVIDAAADLGSPVWSGVIYSAWLRKPEVPWPQSGQEKARARAFCVEGLKRLGRMAEDKGIICCLEVVNRYEQFLFNTAREAVALAEETGSKNIQLLLDTFHMNIEEDSSVAAIRYAAEHGRLGHMHMGESNRRVPCGGGSIDWQEIAGALKGVGYKGLMVMEPFVLTTADNAHRTCVWRDLAKEPGDIEEMVEAAARGTDFLSKLMDG